MTDRKIITLTVGGSVLALAITVPIILTRSGAVETVPAESVPLPRAPKVQTSTPSAVTRSRDATPQERDELSRVASAVEKQGSHLLQPVALDEPSRRQVYLAMYRAIDRAEARGDATYDYRPEIASQFRLTIE
jgi:hypothetical protein